MLRRATAHDPQTSASTTFVPKPSQWIEKQRVAQIQEHWHKGRCDDTVSCMCRRNYIIRYVHVFDADDPGGAFEVLWGRF